MNTYPIVFKTDDYLKGQQKFFKYGIVGGLALALLSMWPFLTTSAPFQLNSALKFALVIVLICCAIYFLTKRPNHPVARTNYRVETDRFVIVGKHKNEEYPFNEYMIKGSSNNVARVISCILSFENSVGKTIKRTAFLKEEQFEQMLSAINTAVNTHERA